MIKKLSIFTSVFMGLSLSLPAMESEVVADASISETKSPLQELLSKESKLEAGERHLSPDAIALIERNFETNQALKRAHEISEQITLLPQKVEADNGLYDYYNDGWADMHGEVERVEVVKTDPAVLKEMLRSLRREWNHYAYLSLSNAMAAVTNEICESVLRSPTKTESLNDPYQKDLRVAFVTLMFQLEQFEFSLEKDYIDSSAYPEYSVISNFWETTSGFLKTAKQWATPSLKAAQTLSEDSLPLARDVFTADQRSERPSKGELSRQYHLARNGLRNMSEAWARVAHGAGEFAAQLRKVSLRNIFAQAATGNLRPSQFTALTSWFSRQTPKNIVEMALAPMKQLKKGIGILELARKHPLLAKDLAANIMHTYKILTASGNWAFLGDIETVYSIKEADNLVGDLLLGAESYLHSSADVNDPALASELLIVCQVAEWLPYAAGAYMGARGKLTSTSLAKSLGTAIAGRFAGIALGAADGIAIVKLQKYAASKVSREQEIAVNTLRHVLQAEWGKDWKTIAKSAAAYVLMREAVKCTGTIACLAKERALFEEGCKRFGSWVVDNWKGLAIGLVLGAGIGTLVGYYWISAQMINPDVDVDQLNEIWGVIAGSFGVIGTGIGGGLDHLIDYCRGGIKKQQRLLKLRERQLRRQCLALPKACADNANSQSSEEELQKVREEIARLQFNDEELQALAREVPAGEDENTWLAARLVERAEQKLQDLDDESTIKAQNAIAGLQNKRFDDLVAKVTRLKSDGATEYAATIGEAIVLLKNGRGKEALDKFELAILNALRALKYDGPEAEIDAILCELNQLRVRQFKANCRNLVPSQGQDAMLEVVIDRGQVVELRDAVAMRPNDNNAGHVAADEGTPLLAQNSGQDSNSSCALQ